MCEECCWRLLYSWASLIIAFLMGRCFYFLVRLCTVYLPPQFIIADYYYKNTWNKYTKFETSKLLKRMIFRRQIKKPTQTPPKKTGAGRSMLDEWKLTYNMELENIIIVWGLYYLLSVVCGFFVCVLLLMLFLSFCGGFCENMV